MTKFLCNAIPETQVMGEVVFEPAGIRGKIFLRSCENGLVASIGAGKAEDFSDSVLRDIVAEFTRYCTKNSFSHLSLRVASEKMSYTASSAVAEGALAGAYRFDKYLSESRKGEKAPLLTFSLIGGDEAGLKQGTTLGEALWLAKDLSNEPGNVLNPSTFAEFSQSLAAECGLECTVLGEKQITEAGMRALWYVGKGSASRPCLVHLVYRPKKPNGKHKKIVIIGKGVTFDSGGLCIKTRDNIKTMKHDKSGACIMLGVMKAVAELGLPVEVHGLAGMVENMPDGDAYRPDDIIRAMNGKTIEVSNTDAEGRLTLADVLTYASELKPDVIIDVATLTGAAVWALGKYTAALVSDHDELSLQLQKAAENSGEKLHRFDMKDRYLRETMNSIHADIRQNSPDGGGTIIGGMFLREFVSPSIPWAHIDIAGTAWYDKEFDIYSKGSSAYSMRTIFEYIAMS